jgi:ethanolamine ammonia-lyase large subunit
MPFKHTVGGITYAFNDLKALLAKATPLRSGDVLAGVAAVSAQERVAAQYALADTLLQCFLDEAVIPYESDEVTRLIVDTHDSAAFAPLAHMTVGEFRDWLLSDAADSETLSKISAGITPEMAAAVSKIMRLQDLILVGQKCRVITKFRNTIGLEGRLSTRLQPNHPTDDVRGVAVSLLDGLLLGAGDAVIGINPATDNVDACIRLLEMIDSFRTRFDMPTQSCVLSHVTTTMLAMQRGAPVDLVFQSIAGSQAANSSFGIDLAMLKEAREMALSLGRGTVGDNVMYFETGQGSALSANAHHGVDQQTIEARAYAVARAFSPLLVNTVVGFIGPEYLYDGKQIIRAGLEDHFCGKLLGLPMGCDICYTNHAEADQDDMDMLLTLLGTAGCNFVMGVPGADDIMLNYQSTSFHDGLYVRKALGKRPAPEFDAWLAKMDIFDNSGARKELDDTQSTSISPVYRALEEMGTDIVPHSSLTTLSSSVWDHLRQYTPARVGIGATGVSQPTGATLDFQRDHATARDAVHSELDVVKLTSEIQRLGLNSVCVSSQARSRRDYLQRPDWGRRLDDNSREMLREQQVGWDVVFVVCDGLSAAAVNLNASIMIAESVAMLKRSELEIGPVVLVEQGRVAIGDDIAVALKADLVVVLIGERPGLCSADSMGVYLTLHPRSGSVDAERNCISNIRRSGLDHPTAAGKLTYLVNAARRLGLSGVALKEGPENLLETDNYSSYSSIGEK